MNQIKKCSSCSAQTGHLHDMFCTLERCPFCGGQLATCECAGVVLILTDEEKEAFDDYIDDSAEPLKGIVDRWRAALEKKGRIPF